MVFSSITTFISDNALVIWVTALTYVLLVIFFAFFTSFYLFWTGRCKREIKTEEDEESSINDIVDKIAGPPVDFQQASTVSRSRSKIQLPPYKTRVMDLKSIERVHPVSNSEAFQIKKDSLGLVEKEDFQNFMDSEDRKEVYKACIKLLGAKERASYHYLRRIGKRSTFSKSKVKSV